MLTMQVVGYGEKLSPQFISDRLDDERGSIYSVVASFERKWPSLGLGEWPRIELSIERISALFFNHERMLSSMKNPKRILRCLILSVFVALGIALATPAHASHIVGAEITYKFLGNDNYLIYVDLYRDYCGANENTLDTIAYIDIFNDSGAQWPDIDPNSKNLPVNYC
jgi:hypothetical protein